MTPVEPSKRPALAGAVSTVVIGAGHAGLAVSYCLSQRGIDHVVLERGEVANSWRTERWDSLRLLTPNWLCRLPGQRYQGDQPDGFMGMTELIAFITRYADATAAPVRCGTAVTAVHPAESGYRVETTSGSWNCRALVIASGAHNLPVKPRFADAIPNTLRSLTTHEYRSPDQLEPGGVLVVGASATGLQLADEIHRSGRPVTLCVGEHVRMPRRYRGRDIMWWMDRIGLLDETWQEVDDLRHARGVPSPQLIGTADGATLDLNALTARGVELVGRLSGVHADKALFSGSLHNVCKLADLKAQRLLQRIDEWIVRRGDTDGEPAMTVEPTRLKAEPRLDLDLRRGEIRTVLWACGFRADYSWLRLPVVDVKGKLRHDGGVTAAPGVYAMGLPFMRRRKSSFIHGAADDARDIADHVAAYLAGSQRQYRPSAA